MAPRYSGCRPEPARHDGAVMNGVWRGLSLLVMASVVACLGLPRPAQSSPQRKERRMSKITFSQGLDGGDVVPPPARPIAGLPAPPPLPRTPTAAEPGYAQPY